MPELSASVTGTGGWDGRSAATSGEATSGEGGSETPDDAALRPWVEERLQARKEARGRRDFATADAIRDELQARGISIADTGAGTTWKQVR